MKKTSLVALLVCLCALLAAQPQPVSGPAALVFVEGGSFAMGSSDGKEDEQPVRDVSVSSFYIGRYEVTQKEWQDVMGSNPSYFEGENLPVERISWYDAVEYCNQRSLREGFDPCYKIDKEVKDPGNSNRNDDSMWTVTCDWTANGYRLPTEAEWEYAARGGGFAYSGSDELDSVAWYEGNSGWSTHEVGAKAPNELGIYDLTGNVQEWCWDWYGREYYAQGPDTDPKGPDSGSFRVIRGGSWFNDDYNCRIPVRYYFFNDCMYFYFGLRVVRAAG